MNLISEAELEKQLHLSFTTLWRWRKQMPAGVAFKIGERVFYDPDKVAKWMATQDEKKRKDQMVDFRVKEGIV